MKRKQAVLFICTENSARSQMAEGFLRALYGDRFTAYSAGSNPKTVNPGAVAAMAEAGIDISHQYSKSIYEFDDRQFEYVVTVCDRAKEACPFFPEAGRYLHKSFVDPAAENASKTVARDRFRSVRDDIKAWIISTFGDIS